MTQTQSYGHGRPISTGQQPVLKIAQNQDSSIKIETSEISKRLAQEDWTDFRSLDTLGRRAGVSREQIPAVVIKELIDNALDESGHCFFHKSGDVISIANPGVIPGGDTDIARLFSINRPRESSKLMRMPSRGALGNGLRVVAGAVLASGGKLSVSTGGRTLTLVPQDNGTTRIEKSEPFPPSTTFINVEFGPALADFDWDGASQCANTACDMAKVGKPYKGKSSPHWFNSDSWFELLQCHGVSPVRQLLEKMDGLTGKKAGGAARDFLNRSCESLSRQEADILLGSAKAFSKAVKAKRLGFVGKCKKLGNAYAREQGIFGIKAGNGAHDAYIPYVVEAWATASNEPNLTICANRTPITAEPSMWRDDEDRNSYTLVLGDFCGSFKVGRKNFAITLNIIAPYIPITNDGKAPHLKPMWGRICAALTKCVNSAKAKSAGSESVSQIDVIRESLDDAIREVSSGGEYRYSLRQLFYNIRTILLAKLEREPKYGTFSQHITAIESQRGGDLPGIYRDNRGVLYHPHTGETIPLGTQSIEQYERPKWSFSKILYCEKEGFFPALIAAKWPERHDCALVTGKGYASRAARDLLDLLGGSDEPLKIFCIHDADGPGTCIYESLAGATAARGGRKVEIVNLGLEPREALKMGLAVEKVDKKRRGKVPVAKYADPDVREWLQSNRVELNAMITRQLIEWLDGKMAEHGGTKLIPPADVQAEYFGERLRTDLKEKLTEQAIKAFDVDGKLKAAIASLETASGDVTGALDERIRKELTDDPTDWWRGPVNRAAKELAESHLDGDGGKP